MTAASERQAPSEEAGEGIEQAVASRDEDRRRASNGNPALHDRVATEAVPEQNGLDRRLRAMAAASEADLLAFARGEFGEATFAARRRGLRRVLDWLHSVPGETWHDRWLLLDGDRTWIERDESFNENARWLWRLGTEVLLCAGSVRPSWAWLMGPRRARMHNRVLEIRHPEWSGILHAALAETGVTEAVVNDTLTNIGRVCIRTGKAVSSLTVEDIIEAHQAAVDVSKARNSQLPLFHLAYQVLRTTGVLPPDSPGNLGGARRVGPLTPKRLVDRYEIRSRKMADLFTLYLTEREPSVDYSTMETLAVRLVGTFWREIERIAAGADSLHLPDSVWQEWKRRMKHEPSPRTKHLRRTQDGVFTTVRAFFLDIADWAQERPDLWAEHVVSCPISRRELAHGGKKTNRQRKSRMDHRTRTLAPLLPRLRESALTRLNEVQSLLETTREVDFGSQVTVDGEEWTRVPPSRLSHNVRLRSKDGLTRNLTHEEDDAFWQWAVVEGLTVLGPRIEELLELTAFDIVPWTRRNGSTVMLLRINPSKTDRERILPLTRDQAATFACIVRRVRGQHPHVPNVSRYDQNERTDGPDLPHLFQRSHNGRRRVISYPTVINLLNRAAEAAGVSDSGGSIRFRPHDFRRMFVTEHINSGLPIHVVAALVGHESLDTTRAYAAVYPQAVIDAFLNHLAKHREQRPESEYQRDERTAASHRKAFDEHFGRRRVRGGDCVRGFDDPCERQHNCARCPLVDYEVDARKDLEAQRLELRGRLEEAIRRGWTASAEGFATDLEAIDGKIAHLERRALVARLPGGESLADCGEGVA